MKYNCIIIDDEELARGLLQSYVKKLDFLLLKGSFENPLDALPLIKSEKIDLLFLDIQMPEITGTSFAKLIPESTKIIFTTAYSEFALKGFELNALDYLLKPISFERFMHAISKLPTFDKTSTNTLTVKSGYDIYKIDYNDILYIKSEGEYVIYNTVKKNIMSYQTLKSLEKTLPPDIFIRIHRSYIVNKNKVTGLVSRNLLLDSLKLPISDSYFDTVKKELF